MTARNALIVALSLATLGLSSCGSTSETRVDSTTTGQELTDLKKAYDEGVITKSEYERKRKDILKR